ncbi:hypothetical protein ACODT3_38925 [Streptomyces sp. 4.24]|uniref:hypothetical protein n=1 Tax=Streptomyces tritrimontium TaxID=3406573 RepID=UPI003BB8026F
MRRHKTAAALGTLIITLAGLFVGSAGTAQAAAQSCYGSGRSYASDEGNYWPHGDALAVSTSNCSDINVKPGSGTYVRTCFVPSSGGWYCNGWRWINGGSWGLAATDVKDGTKFYLAFDRHSTGSVAY